MQYLVLLQLLAVMSVYHFTAKYKVLPPLLSFLPEIISGMVMMFVIIAGARTRFRYVSPVYWIAFGAMALVIICGIVANTVGPGPIFAGLRYYIRAIPFFFLPAVYAFSEKQIRQQFRWLAILCLFQLPLALQERLLVITSNRTSGDSVVGSLEDSSCLSIVLIAGVLVMTGLTVRGLMTRTRFIILFLLFLLPTTINETKATLILLPIGLVLTMVVASPPTRRLRVVFVALGLLMGFFAIFAPIYEYLQRNTPYHVPITTFFTDPDAFMRYIDNHAEAGSAHVGRLDAIKVPMQWLVKEPSRLAFGVGIGNASHSELGTQFTGDYFLRFERFLLSTLSTFLLEIGILGTGLVFLLYWFIFRDSLAVARNDRTYMGAVACAWAGVAVIAVISMPYKTTYTFPSLSFLFWYLSGLVAARRMILERGVEVPWQPPVQRPIAAPVQQPVAAIARQSH